MDDTLDHRAFFDWSAKHGAWVFDGLMLYNDMAYAMFDKEPVDLRLLQSRFFTSLFWKNRYVLINQLNRLFSYGEEASLPTFIKELARPDLEPSKLKEVQCSDQQRRELSERCTERLEAHREVIDRNRIVRNKTIAHGLLKPPPGNVIAWEDLRALVMLGMELHQDVQQTLFGRTEDLDIPEQSTLRFVVERMRAAGVDLQ